MKKYSILMSARKLSFATQIKPGEYGTYCRHSRRGEYSAAHTHDFVELFWVEKGPGIHWINGEERQMEAGMLQLIRASDSHALYAVPGFEFAWTNVTFSMASWRLLKRRYFSGRSCFFDLVAAGEREYRLAKDQEAALRIAAADLDNGARDLLTFERFLLNVLALISGAERGGSAIPAWLKRLDQELHQQANFPRGVASVVKEAGRCAEHVYREYRRYFGRTPTETMTSARMEYASGQLAGTEVKIVDLAQEVGFQNVGHFYRTFEKHYHCTPREYRRQLPQGDKTPLIRE